MGFASAHQKNTSLEQMPLFLCSIRKMYCWSDLALTLIWRAWLAPCAEQNLLVNYERNPGGIQFKTAGALRELAIADFGEAYPSAFERPGRI